MNEMAEYHLMNYGFQYYVAARSAALAQLSVVAGNLFHHAFELFFKARLALSTPLDDLRRFGHDLGRLWAAFKAEFPSEAFSRFDPLIAAIHEYERIRYPNRLIERGAELMLDFGRTSTIESEGDERTIERYRLAVRDADLLVVALFEACSRNLRF